ncbi:MAG TPA: methyltransferase domain-containing protein, partial [Ktedonobacteraceae bacterium]|nr:methyltransferase domain-containing protein [Ktedonobacteraceae bacterium]
MKIEELYTSGEYLEKNPTWHVEESPWKATQIMRMLRQNHLAPETICEAGCGAGEVLKQLQERIAPGCEFWGYDISPQAFEMSRSRANEHIHFKLADITQEKDVFFDLMLVLDVVEHLEDYFTFLRDLQSKSTYKIIHLPLDLSVQSLMRPGGLLGVRRAYGHVHYFSKDLALEMLKEVGYEVVDYFYAPRSIGLANSLAKKLLIPPRLLFYG